jgi:tetratricopeptide (TPR) repeat protein
MKRKDTEEDQTTKGENLPIRKDQIKFDLSDDKKEFINLDLKDDNISGVDNFLQKIHLKNHSIASKETIHEMYRTEEEFLKKETNMLSSEDEILMDEVQKAIEEQDVLALRANLQFIAKNTSAHSYSFEELEQYVEGDLDETLKSTINQELLINSNLKEDLTLLEEIDKAIIEKDIIQLRSDIAAICENEVSHSRSIAEIEEYISNDLEETSRDEFEEEMLSNPGLMKDVKFFKEVNEAIGEKDVMSFRNELHKINDAEINDEAQKRGVAPRLQKTIWIAAASIILLMGLNITFREHSFSNVQLYNQFYQPFDTNIGVSRSASMLKDNLVNKAMLKLNEKDFSSALHLFSNELKTDPDNVICNYYTGAIQQMKGNYEEAINAFNNVIKQADNLFIEQSQWNIGLCYLGRNENEKAIKQFRRIVEQQGYYQKQAEKLLKKLE